MIIIYHIYAVPVYLSRAFLLLLPFFNPEQSLFNPEQSFFSSESHNSAVEQVVDAAISESVFNMLEGCVPEYVKYGYNRPPSGSTITGTDLPPPHTHTHILPLLSM
jgi:hypothetical protein